VAISSNLPEGSVENQNHENLVGIADPLAEPRVSRTRSKRATYSIMKFGTPSKSSNRTEAIFDDVAIYLYCFALVFLILCYTLVA
jgi:hypothetical protein